MIINGNHELVISFQSNIHQVHVSDNVNLCEGTDISECQLI